MSLGAQSVEMRVAHSKSPTSIDELANDPGFKLEKRPSTQGPPVWPLGLVDKTPDAPALPSSSPASSGSPWASEVRVVGSGVAVGSGKSTVLAFERCRPQAL